jgi:hypothetical protein
LASYTGPSAIASVLEALSVVTGLPVEATVRTRADLVFTGTLEPRYDEWDDLLSDFGGLVGFAQEAGCGALELACIVCRFKAPK